MSEAEFEQRVWSLLWAYHGDAEKKRVARDDNGTPNVYNTLLLILEELFPERMRALWDNMERMGR